MNYVRTVCFIYLEALWNYMMFFFHMNFTIFAGTKFLKTLQT
jgi:hypothetical protein